jgi:hypothetical protein
VGGIPAEIQNAFISKRNSQLQSYTSETMSRKVTGNVKLTSDQFNSTFYTYAI